MNRRCCKGLHKECNGQAWDYEHETVTVCHCACHAEKK